MRILVLSLLRTGDLFMHIEVIKALMDKHKKKGVEVNLELVINDECSHAVEVIRTIEPNLGEIHILPRTKLQCILVENSFSPLNAEKIFRNWLKNLNQYGFFDEIYNITHTLFSARLMGLIHGKHKYGAYFDDGSARGLDSFWVKLLNNELLSEENNLFHYVDILHGLVNTDKTRPRSYSKKGRAKKDIYSIVIQPFTSDIKKNWPLIKFQTLVEKIGEVLPKAEVIAFLAPNEEQKFMEEWNFDCAPIRPLKCNLKQAFEFLQNSDILITGDTSIQHLASYTQIKILSLFLGSANPRKTSPRTSSSRVLSGVSDCFPCSHSKDCVKPSYICKENLTVEVVLDSLLELLLEEKGGACLQI